MIKEIKCNKYHTNIIRIMYAETEVRGGQSSVPREGNIFTGNSCSIHKIKVTYNFLANEECRQAFYIFLLS